jgi:protein-S-isoprenylcysteine O-methyltransferase Ste14
MAAAPESSRVFIPPAYFLVALLLMGFFHRVAPGAYIIQAPYRYAGLVIAALALGLILWAAVLFPRNPMYLGMAGILLGAALFMGSLTPFVVIPAFMALIAERFILSEEAKLEAAFGREYLDYKARVRRWL